MKTFKLMAILFLMVLPSMLWAWEGMSTPQLRVQGRFLKDTQGNIVNLHGFALTPSPWFNRPYWGTTNGYDVEGCLTYMQNILDALTDTDQGWYCNYIRLHLDPHWSNEPGCYTPNGEASINCFNEDRFRRYLDEVMIPIMEYANSRGMYVVMRPPGVCPEIIGAYDDYFYYLYNIWDIISSHPKLKNTPYLMFEIANEPVTIRLANGTVGANTQAHFDVLKQIFQPIVNLIRTNGANNILWIPGSGYQSQYKGYAVNPIEGENIGYAVHWYPGYLGTGNGNSYEVMKAAWDENIIPVADFAPIMVTEIDWAPEEYNASWGKAVTGDRNNPGFGFNFKRIVDELGNVSWNFLGPDNLLSGNGDPNGELAYGGDWRACAAPGKLWFSEYATANYFPFSSVLFNPSIFESGTFDENTRTLTTGQWGSGGWSYSWGMDISSYRYLVAELNEIQSCGTELRLFDENSYWSASSNYAFGNSQRIIVDLHSMTKQVGNNVVSCDPSHIYMICFWSYGFSPIKMKRVYLTNSENVSLFSTYSGSEIMATGLEIISPEAEDTLVDVYTISGTKVQSKILRSKAIQGLPAGIYIVGKEKIAIFK